MACILTLLMTTAFVNSAATRDFPYNTHQFIFTTPLRKRDYLLGRFLGALWSPSFRCSASASRIIVAKYMPWVDAERWGAIDWLAHWHGILVFAIPNTFFIAAIIFAIAVLTRSTITSFLGACPARAYAVAETFIADIDNETIAMLIDPFGIHTFSLMTKYWTVADTNTALLGPRRHASLESPHLARRGRRHLRLRLSALSVRGAQPQSASRSRNEHRPKQSTPSNAIRAMAHRAAVDQFLGATQRSSSGAS